METSAFGSCNGLFFLSLEYMESMSDVYYRVLNFLREKHQIHLGVNVVVTTHNGVMKALFMYASAIQGFDVDYASFDLGNASILVVEVNDNEVCVVAASGLRYREAK
jgi:broad specificity phosphatase PhoE